MAPGSCHIARGRVSATSAEFAGETWPHVPRHSGRCHRHRRDPRGRGPREKMGYRISRARAVFGNSLGLFSPGGGGRREQATRVAAGDDQGVPGHAAAAEAHQQGAGAARPDRVRVQRRLTHPAPAHACSAPPKGDQGPSFATLPRFSFPGSGVDGCAGSGSGGF